MKTPVLPAPKGIPARIGAIQWIVAGEQVHANQSSPTGIRIAAMQTTETIDSGGTLPVSGSSL